MNLQSFNYLSFLWKRALLAVASFFFFKNFWGQNGGKNFILSYPKLKIEDCKNAYFMPICAYFIQNEKMQIVSVWDPDKQEEILSNEVKVKVE